jgi:DNA-binding CsgD family transcriptional regulator
VSEHLFLRRASMTEDADASVDRLTQAQVDCLMLVNQHMTSKQIAQRRGVSSHTVDQRIRTALRILGCTSRSQAARLVAFRRLPAAMVDWYSLESNPYVDDGGPTPTRGPIHLPLATRAHPTNEMSISVRLFWIVTIAAAVA